MNELLLIGSLVVIFALVLLFFRLFGKTGLYCWTVFATLTANIEVLIVVDAFGMEQTLGNILFASTFLVTDLLSEFYGKEASKKAVRIGIASSAAFILISQSWLHYVPSESDFAMPHMQAIFSNTPRLMLASFLVYAICQRFDVWAYHKWWAFTTKKYGDSDRFLWLRNNGSTLLSQLLNSLLFTFGAFAGIYELPTLISITWATYIIYIVTSLADTPVMYFARYLVRHKGKPGD